MSDRFPLPPYQWPAPYRAGAIVSVNVEGEAPLAWRHRNQTLTTLGELEARRFGPREGVWRILSLLDGLALQVVAHGTTVSRDDVQGWTTAAAEMELGLASGALAG